MSHDDAQLETLYDEATLRAIESRGASGEPTARVPTRRAEPLPLPRRVVAAGGIAAAAALTGARYALDDDEEARTHVMEVRPEAAGGAPRRVTLYFVPHAPRLTRAVVRPWLPA